MPKTNRNSPEHSLSGQRAIYSLNYFIKFFHARYNVNNKDKFSKRHVVCFNKKDKQKFPVTWGTYTLYQAERVRCNEGPGRLTWAGQRWIYDCLSDRTKRESRRLTVIDVGSLQWALPVMLWSRGSRPHHHSICVPLPSYWNKPRKAAWCLAITLFRALSTFVPLSSFQLVKSC